MEFPPTQKWWFWVCLRVVNSFENLWCYKLFFFSKFFAIYFAIKVAIKWWNFFTMEKVLNPTFPKNNLFHQVYSITTFGVVFFHPLGLTEPRLLTVILLRNHNVIAARQSKKKTNTTLDPPASPSASSDSYSSDSSVIIPPPPVVSMSEQKIAISTHLNVTRPPHLSL